MKITAKLIKEIVEEQLAEMNAAASTAGVSSDPSGPPDIDDDKRASELLDGFRSMLKPNEKADPGACATFLRQLADLVDHENAAANGQAHELPANNLEEGKFSDFKTKIDQWANPGKHEDRSSDEFIEKRYDEAYQLLAAARSIVGQLDKRMASKILDVESKVMQLRDEFRGAMNIDK